MRSTWRAETALFFLVAALIVVGAVRSRVYYWVTTVETTTAPPVGDLPRSIRTAGYQDRQGDHAIALTQRRIDELVRRRPELSDRVWTLRLRENGRPDSTEFRYEPRPGE